MKIQNKYVLTTIFESDLYSQDVNFEIEKIQQIEKCDYSTAENLLKTYKFTEDTLNQIDEEKTSYYLGDFWNISSILRDNKYGLEWEIYVDNVNNEVIFGNGIATDFNGNKENVEFDSDYQKMYYDLYQNLFEAYRNNSAETKYFIEVDNIFINGDGSAAEGSDGSKADYVLKILLSNGNGFGFWEYNEK